jgi:hypothetical protein
MSNWYTQYTHGDGGAGLASFQRAVAAGHSPAEAAQAVRSSGLTIGEKLQQHLAGINSTGGGGTGMGGWGAQQMQMQQQMFDTQLQGYRTQLNDWSSRYNDMQNQYQTALTDRNEYEGKFQQATEDYESAKALAETYKGEAINQQLNSLRTGATYQGGQVNPYASIASGAVSNRQRQNTDMLVNVDKSVKAEDSVLATKGPAVEVISGGIRRQPDNNPQAGGGNQPASYYADRFG